MNDRFDRWSHKGLWTRIFGAPSMKAEFPIDLSTDSTAVLAHLSANGRKGWRRFRSSVTRQPTAEERVTLTRDLYAFDAHNSDSNLDAQQECSIPTLTRIEDWISQDWACTFSNSPLDEAPPNIAKYRTGFGCTVTNCRVENDSNTIERSSN